VRLFFFCHPHLYAPGGGILLYYRGGGVGGVGGVNISPSTKTSSRGGQTSPLSFTPKTAGSAQQCIYIDESRIKSLCLGGFGSSRQFCLADKSPFYSHCSVPSHGKGSTGSKKFDAKFNTFYVPGGPSTSRPTAKMEPFVHRDNIPRHLLPVFKKGLKTSTDWEQLITQTVLAAEVNDTYDYKDEVIKEEEDNDAAMEDRDFEECFTIMSVMEEGGFEEIEIKLEWDFVSSCQIRWWKRWEMRNASQL
jgi:hypothetical protein